MAEVFRIEIPVEVQNQTGPGVKQAQNNLNGFEKSIQKTRKQVEQLNKTKLQLLGSGLNNTMRSLDNMRRTLVTITGRTWHIGLSVASAPFRMLNSIKDTLFSIPNLIAAAVTGFAAQKAIFDPLKYADSLQRASITFKTFLGSQQEGDKFFNQLQKFGAETPLETSDLTKWATQMLPVIEGNSSQKEAMTMRTLKAFGDTAALTGVGSQQIDMALYGFRQISGSGTLKMQDLRQVTDNLLLPMTAVQKQLGLTAKQMSDVGTQGIPAAKAMDAILKAMEQPVDKGGFLGGMEAQMDTLSGQFAYLRDTLKMGLYSRWANGLKSVALPVLKDMNTWFNNNSKTVSAWGDKLEAAGHKLGTWVIDRVQGLKSSLTKLTTSPEWQHATTFGQKVGVAWDFISDGFQSWWSSHKDGVMRTFGDAGGFLGSALKGGIMTALGLIDPADKVSKDQSPFVTAGAEAGKSFFDKFLEQLDPGKIAQKLGETAKDVVIPSKNKNTFQNVAGVGAAVLGGSWLLSKIAPMLKFLGPVGGVIGGSMLGSQLGGSLFGDQGSMWGGLAGAGLGGTLFSWPFLKRIPGWVKKGIGKEKAPIPAPPVEALPPSPSRVLGPNGKSISEYQYRPANTLTEAESAARKTLPKTSALGKVGKFLGPLGEVFGLKWAADIGDQLGDYVFGHTKGMPKPGLNPLNKWQDTRLPIWDRTSATSGQEGPPAPSQSQVPIQPISVQLTSTPQYFITTSVDPNEVLKVIRDNQEKLSDEFAYSISLKLGHVFNNFSFIP